MAKKQPENRDTTIPPITGSFEDAVRALLKTPPAPKNLGRPAAKTAKKRKATARALKERFDAAHRKGMKALEVGDSEKVGEAIADERTVILEQRRLINERLAQTTKNTKPRARKAKKR